MQGKNLAEPGARRTPGSSPTTGAEMLRHACVASLPRLLTLIDRAPFSPTRGSADRAFWHYRVDKDYPSATYAQVAWPIALLATRPGLGIPERLRPRLADLALDAMRWWASLQHPDGSTDEWFPFERSHVATAFTAFAVAEAAALLGERFTRSTARGPVLSGLARAAGWLGENHDFAVANHAAGAVAALASIHTLLPGSSAGEAAERELAHLLSLQDEEGFLPEYGGADPGYGSVTLAFLAHAARHLEAGRLDGALARLLAFLAPFVNPDGSFGGEHGRRATHYAWLSGFALLAPRFATARRVRDRLLGGIARGALALPADFDDRYFCFFALPDAVATLDAIDAGPKPEEYHADAPETAETAETLFPRAGLAVLHGGGLHVTVGAAVGGALKAWSETTGTLLYDDCGYSGRLAGSGRLVASWRFGARTSLEPGRVSSDGPFQEWSRASPIASHPIAFRVFNRTLGRIPGVSLEVARRAKERFTGKPEPAPLRLFRQVTLEGGALRILDLLEPGALARPEELRRVAGFAPVHVPSAPLWRPAFEPLLPALGPDVAALVAAGPVEVTTTLTPGDGFVQLVVEAAGKILDSTTRAL